MRQAPQPMGASALHVPWREGCRGGRGRTGAGAQGGEGRPRGSGAGCGGGAAVPPALQPGRGWGSPAPPQLQPEPVHVALHVREDGRQLEHGAADAPADHAHLDPGPLLLAHQGAPPNPAVGRGGGHRSQAAGARSGGELRWAGRAPHRAGAAAQGPGTQHVPRDGPPVGSGVQEPSVTLLAGPLLFQGDLHVLQAVGVAAGLGRNGGSGGGGACPPHPVP